MRIKRAMRGRMLVGLIVFIGLCTAGLVHIVMAQSTNGVAYEEKSYWDEGHTQLRTLQQYDDQRRQHGLLKSWSMNGTLTGETIFDHGQIVSHKSWYPTGKKRIDEHAREGLMDGWQTWWGPDGSVLKRVYFTMGTGVEYYFDDEGREKTHVFWISGVELQRVEAPQGQK